MKSNHCKGEYSQSHTCIYVYITIIKEKEQMKLREEFVWWAPRWVPGASEGWIEPKFIELMYGSLKVEKNW